METQSKEIIECNKLIAEFMGVKPKEAKYDKHWYDGYELYKAGLPFAYGAMGNGTYNPKFDTSWDWLMPVVKKCLAICHEEMLNEWENYFCDIFLACDVLLMHKAVTEFIEWYNKNKPE
jgi:hypothetical protein